MTLALRGLLAAVLSMAWIGCVVTSTIFVLLNTPFNEFGFFTRMFLVSIPIVILFCGFVPLWDWVFRDRFRQ